MPAAQAAAMDEILMRLRSLDLDSGGKIKATVKNLRLIDSLRNKLVGIILNDDYVEDLKEYVKAFRDVTSLQNSYWKTIESDFTPRPLLKEIRKQAVTDTVNKLTEAGIGTNIADKLTDILRTNITSGGSYKELEQQLRDSLMNNRTGEGILEKYTKQITTDALNQYSAQYTQTVSGDFGAEWYQYQGTDIKTTRCFCDAMTDQPYFHISEIPRLLKGQNLQCTSPDGTKKDVELYPKTKLPYGMIEGTNPENFFIRRGGYNCGHQIRPVLRESSVPLDVRQRVYATPEYQAWKKQS